MPENDVTMIDVLKVCLELDGIAATEYEKFAAFSGDAELTEFWRGMAQEELRHASYWEELIGLAANGALPIIFDDPGKIHGELQATCDKVCELIRNNDPSRTQGNLITAARMEFYMLHKAFGELFHFISNISEEESVEDAYERHVKVFISGLMSFGKNSPELELLSDSLERLWRENRELSNLGSMDSLTGIFNRRGLLQTITPMIHLWARNGYHVGVLMLDIDDFKKVNDTMGHSAGDEVLKFIAHNVRACLRRSDVACRWGGEEFLVFLSKIEPGSSCVVGEKIRALIEFESRSSVPVTVSLGTCEGIPGTDAARHDLAAFIKTADDNLYTAKRNGKNRVVCTAD